MSPTLWLSVTTSLFFFRPGKLQNETFPNFSNFRPEFCPEFCSEFSPNCLRTFRALFRGRQRPEKINQKSPPFFNVKFPGKNEKNIHKILLESRRSNSSSSSSLSSPSSSLSSSSSSFLLLLLLFLPSSPPINARTYSLFQQTEESWITVGVYTYLPVLQFLGTNLYCLGGWETGDITSDLRPREGPQLIATASGGHPFRQVCADCLCSVSVGRTGKSPKVPPRVLSEVGVLWGGLRGVLPRVLLERIGRPTDS